MKFREWLSWNEKSVLYKKKIEALEMEENQISRIWQAWMLASNIFAYVRRLNQLKGFLKQF